MSDFHPPVTIVMPGDPVGWERAGKKGKAHFTRPQHQAQMDAIAWRAAGQRLRQFPGAVRMDIVGIFGIPQSYLHGRRMKMIGRPVAKAPDFDNILKLAADALEPLAYARDAQISIGTVAKIWGLTPRTIIMLSAIEPDVVVALPWMEGIEP